MIYFKKTDTVKYLNITKLKKEYLLSEGNKSISVETSKHNQNV